jgi:gamma-glutamylcyclotransferase (GGCT)/AIG2-like uncharacterized protein YtfP
MNYFAYGSNMSFEHMRRLCGRHFTVLGAGSLPGFELGADLRGYINIKKNPSTKVMGVLYDLDQEALSILDEFEGYPEVFSREIVEVIDSENEKYNSWVYLENAGQFGGSFVKEEYLRRVISGAVENHLPAEWVQFLTSFQNK